LCHESRLLERDLNPALSGLISAISRIVIEVAQRLISCSVNHSIFAKQARTTRREMSPVPASTMQVIVIAIADRAERKSTHV
jgi:hypothetical protein